MVHSTTGRLLAGRIIIGAAIVLVMVSTVGASPMHLASPVDVTPLTLPGHILSQIQDVDLQQIVLGIPSGARRLVIHPDSGLGDEGNGRIDVLDGQGRVIQQEAGIAGLAIRLMTSSDMVGIAGPTEEDPLVIELPESTSRVEIRGQYYDEEGYPLADGAVRCYSRSGSLLLDESALELDLFMF